MEKPNISGSSDTISRNYASGDAQIFSFELRETVENDIVGDIQKDTEIYLDSKEIIGKALVGVSCRY